MPAALIRVMVAMVMMVGIAMAIALASRPALEGRSGSLRLTRAAG